MKKLFLLLLIASLTKQTASAQENAGRDFKRFGVLLGGTFSNMDFNKGYPTPTTSVTTSWIPGFTVGLLMRVPLSEKLFIQPQYQFTQMGGKIASSNTKYKLNYFSMPLLLKYIIASKVELEIGPQFDLLINAKAIAADTSANVTHGLQEPNIGITAGAGYRLTKNLNLDLRYMQGINHVGFGKLSDQAEFKFGMVQLVISTSF